MSIKHLTDKTHSSKWPTFRKNLSELEKNQGKNNIKQGNLLSEPSKYKNVTFTAQKKSQE